MSIIKDAPEEIYLVIEGVEPGDTFKDCHDVTWEAEQINDNDVKYIRADKLAALEADAARLKFLVQYLIDYEGEPGDADCALLDAKTPHEFLKALDAMKGGA